MTGTRKIRLKCEECGASLSATKLTPEQALRISEDFWDAGCEYGHMQTLKQAKLDGVAEGLA